VVRTPRRADPERRRLQQRDLGHTAPRRRGSLRLHGRAGCGRRAGGRTRSAERTLRLHPAAGGDRVRAAPGPRRLCRSGCRVGRSGAGQCARRRSSGGCRGTVERGTRNRRRTRMRLGRLGERGTEIPVLHAGGTVFDLRSITDDLDGAFFARGGTALVREAHGVGALAELPDAMSLRVGAPIARPGKVVCIGLTYRDHAAETGAELPPEPIVFLKDPMTPVGAYDEARIPRGSTKTDWEVELGVVIGSEVRYAASPEEA